MLRRITVLSLAVLTLVACGDATGPENRAVVNVAFGTTTAPRSASAERTALHPVKAFNTVVGGTNGTLDIQSVHMVVDELKLEGTHEGCIEIEDDGEDEAEDCEEFERKAFLLELPLDGNTVQVVSEDVREGSYSGFEFEVEDVEIDEDGDDEDEADELQLLHGQLLALHSDWPEEASMVVEGTFAPEGGASRPFRVFLEAEIEIEMTFDEPLVVGADQVATVEVVLDPGMWFTRADGTVVDLSAYDYTGDEDDILEIEAEFEKGVTRIEWEDHD